MSVTQASIGIDWGTHSSKWTWNWLEPEFGRVMAGRFRILYSDVRLEDDSHRIFLSDEPPLPSSQCETSVKGRLIKNPDALFWASPQRRSRLTLGELVSFSLWFLLGECYDNLCGTVGSQPEKIDIRFSLPNWVHIAEGAVGRAYYEQAARVKCHMFANDREGWSKLSRPLRQQWQDDIRDALDALDISDDSRIDTDDPEGFRSMLQRSFNVDRAVTFRFVAESSAAGLVGLRVTDQEEKRFLRKILVVDVGAGSTDIGYVLRSIPPKSVGIREALCQLPPANTCQIAGEDLTRRIVGIYRARGETISFAEAELRKTQGTGSEWLSDPNVNDWIGFVADHVRSYLSDVPDKHWLPELPGLQVLITGGSGVVPGLHEAILAAARDGLRNRGVAANVIDATTLMSLTMDGPAAKDANRLAVAFGAASEDFPRLSYVMKIDPALRQPTVQAAPSWT